MPLILNAEQGRGVTEEGDSTDGGVINEGGVTEEGGISITDKPHSCFLVGSVDVATVGARTRRGKVRAAVETARGATASTEVGRVGAGKFLRGH